MARILLIGCNLATYPYPVFPLGLAQVAGALVASGHEVRQVDMQCSGLSVTELLAQHESFNADVISISVRNIDDVDSHHDIKDNWYLDQTRRIIAEVKKASSAPIILGGAGFSLMAAEVLKFTGADLGVIGEGEPTMPKVIAKLEAANWNAAALAPLHTSPKMAGESIPAPLIDEAMGKFYCTATGIMGIQSKRGCPYNCAYCSYPLIEGSSMRFREPESVAEQMERAHKDFGVNHFVFCDSVFNDRQEQYLKVAEAIKKRNLPVHWSGYFRPSHTTLEQLEFLKASGLQALEIGTDSASNATLEGMNKPFTFDEVHHFNSLCTDLELAAAHFIIMGGPKETYETLNEGLLNIRALTRSVIFVYQGVRVLPNTLMEKIALEEGVLSKDTSLLKPTYYHTAHVPQDELASIVEQDFAGDMTRMFPPSKANKMDKALRAMGHTGLLWDKLLASPRKRRRRVPKQCASGNCNG